MCHAFRRKTANRVSVWPFDYQFKSSTPYQWVIKLVDNSLILSLGGRGGGIGNKKKPSMFSKQELNLYNLPITIINNFNALLLS